MSRACITIQAGYVCVVRSGTAQDQAYHLPPNVCHGSKTSGSWRRTVKLFLGLRLYPKSGAYPLLGVTTILIGNFWGPLKQTNKQTNLLRSDITKDLKIPDKPMKGCIGFTYSRCQVVEQVTLPCQKRNFEHKYFQIPDKNLDLGKYSIILMIWLVMLTYFNFYLIPIAVWVLY